MANANMGIKRQCLSCDAKFFDLAKDPILCPKCGATFEPVLLARSPPRRVGRVFSAAPGPFEGQSAATSEAEAAPAEEVEESVEEDGEENLIENEA